VLFAVAGVIFSSMLHSQCGPSAFSSQVGKSKASSWANALRASVLADLKILQSCRMGALRHTQELETM
jgi:hypothetical protein